MKKKIIAILGIIIVISVCGGIYLHISRANEKIETIEQETESTQGDKPGYIYIPGYGYIVDQGGGVIEGSPEGAENGNKIGVMN